MGRIFIHCGSFFNLLICLNLFYNAGDVKAKARFNLPNMWCVQVFKWKGSSNTSSLNKMWHCSFVSQKSTFASKLRHSHLCISLLVNNTENTGNATILFNNTFNLTKLFFSICMWFQMVLINPLVALLQGRLHLFVYLQLLVLMPNLILQSFVLVPNLVQLPMSLGPLEWNHQIQV